MDEGASEIVAMQEDVQSCLRGRIQEGHVGGSLQHFEGHTSVVDGRHMLPSNQQRGYRCMQHGKGHGLGVDVSYAPATHSCVTG